MLRTAAVFLAVLTCLTLLTNADALSPPVEVNVSLQGSPTRVDSDGRNILAIAFSDRNTLGFYYVSSASYIEVDLESPALMTVFARGYAVTLLRNGDKLAVIDPSSRRISLLRLENQATSVASDGENVYVVYRRVAKIDKLDVSTLTAIDSISARTADGVEHAAAAAGTLYVVGENLNELLILGQRPASVKIDGLIASVKATNDGAWLILSDDTVVKVSGSSIVSRTNLPRATFVTSATVVDGKLVYVSVSRRVIGIVDSTGYRETRIPEHAPSSVASTAQKRIWFLDGLSKKLWSMVDSAPPRLSDWRVETRTDGSTMVKVRATDPDDDLQSVTLVAVEYQGIFSLGTKTIPMNRVQDFFEAVYRPSEGVTRAELLVNATDKAFNSVSNKVGDVEYRASQTSPQVTVATTTIPSNPVATTVLLSELLLLIPLVLVVALLVLSRKTRRKKPKKR